MDEKLKLRDELIKEQSTLIGLFDDWVMHVKKNELEEARRVKDLSMTVRKKVWALESEIKKEKKSLIITKTNRFLTN